MVYNKIIMKKIILNLKVKTISNRGEKLIFNLTREINHRISDKEIEFEFLGYTFSYKKQNTDQMDVFKVTEIISYSYPLLKENLSDKSSLFISQKTNLKNSSTFSKLSFTIWSSSVFFFNVNFWQFIY